MYTLLLQGSELCIDKFDIQTVKLAGNLYLLILPLLCVDYGNFLLILLSSIICLGLLHDVGHGPFSHMFEKEFLPKVLNNNKW